jgi:hypothetical protein
MALRDLGKNMGKDIFSKIVGLSFSDLNKHIWVEVEKALADRIFPNWWEITIHPDDADSLGGTRAVAVACREEIVQKLGIHSTGSEPIDEIAVICATDPNNARGHVDVYTDELDEHSLASEVSLARKSGLTVITSDNLSTPILNRHYALKCPWDGAVIPVDRSLTIGRSPTCNLPIPAEYRFVSGLHGQVIQDPNSNSGWSYIARDSNNGSTLNDNPVSPNEKVPLSPGDRIGLGGVCDVVFGVV